MDLKSNKSLLRVPVSSAVTSPKCCVSSVPDFPVSNGCDYKADDCGGNDRGYI